MATTINSNTTDGLVITPDTSGEVKIQSNGTDVLTITSSGMDLATGMTLPASKLTGALPAIDGSALTGVSSYADSDVKTLFNVTGSAPMYACRAMCRFNGKNWSVTTTKNVSSVVDNGVGDYTVNFATAMPNANYIWIARQYESQGRDAVRISHNASHLRYYNWVTTVSSKDDRDYQMVHIFA